MPPEPEPWLVVACRARTELAERDALRRRGVDAVVMTETRRYAPRRRSGSGPRWRERQTPLVPGYLFAPARCRARLADILDEPPRRPNLHNVVGPIPEADLMRLEALAGRTLIPLEPASAPAIGARVLIRIGGVLHAGRLHSLWRDRAGVVLGDGERVIWTQLGALATR